jgi:hypothetical protein
MRTRLRRRCKPPPPVTNLMLAVSHVLGPTNGQVAGAISALRAKVGGGKEVNISTQAYDMSMNYVPPTSIVPADSNALAFGRTVAEVLPIVYLGGTDKVSIL